MRDDVLVLADEAHRTPYGRFAEQIRRALPNAAFVAFRVTSEQTFEALVGLLGDMGAETQRVVREGLDEEHLAVFDLLCARGGDLAPADRARVKEVAVALLDRVKQELERDGASVRAGDIGVG